MRSAFFLASRKRPGEAMENFAASILLRRPAQPEDIVPTALFLASSDSDYKPAKSWQSTAVKSWCNGTIWGP